MSQWLVWALNASESKSNAQKVFKLIPPFNEGREKGSHLIIIFCHDFKPPHGNHKP